MVGVAEVLAGLVEVSAGVVEVLAGVVEVLAGLVEVLASLVEALDKIVIVSRFHVTDIKLSRHTGMDSGILSMDGNNQLA